MRVAYDLHDEMNPARILGGVDAGPDRVASHATDATVAEPASASPAAAHGRIPAPRRHADAATPVGVGVASTDTAARWLSGPGTAGPAEAAPSRYPTDALDATLVDAPWRIDDDLPAEGVLPTGDAETPAAGLDAIGFTERGPAILRVGAPVGEEALAGPGPVLGTAADAGRRTVAALVIVMVVLVVAVVAATAL